MAEKKIYQHHERDSDAGALADIQSREIVHSSESGYHIYKNAAGTPRYTFTMGTKVMAENSGQFSFLKNLTAGAGGTASFSKGINFEDGSDDFVGVSQFGITSIPVFSYEASSLGCGLYTALRFAAAPSGTYVTDEAVRGYFSNTTKAVGQTINTEIGLKIDNVSAGSSANYAIVTGIGQVQFGDKLTVLGTLNSYGHLPVANDTYYIGASGLAWKGMVLKDTTDGSYYRMEVTNGTLVATGL